MGIFKKISKSVSKATKKVFKLTGGITGVNYLTKKLKTPQQSILGIGAMKDMAAGNEESLRRQSEASKLDSMDEVQNVTQLDDSGGEDFAGGGSRRKKRQSGAFSSGVGLNY